MAASMEMYQEQILDHYKHPRNKGSLPAAQFHGKDSNPLCGDEVTVHVLVDGPGRVAEARFEGQGCAISQASASMLTTLVRGMLLADARAMEKDAILNTLGIPLGAGLLYPVLQLVVSPELAGAMMAVSSVSVTLNTLLLKRFAPSFGSAGRGATADRRSVDRLPASAAAGD